MLELSIFVLHRDMVWELYPFEFLLSKNRTNKLKSKIFVRFNESSLEKVNIKIVDKTEIALKCKTFKQTWLPNKQTNGRLPRGCGNVQIDVINRTINIMSYAIKINICLLSFTLISFIGCSKKIECPQCKGEGKITCSNCGGDLVAEHQEDCPTCKNGKVMCQECDGEGSGQCRDCDGAGLKLTVCYACGGSGLNNGHYGTCGVCNGSAMSMRPCTKCNGSGNFECDECNGQGYLACDECDGRVYIAGSEHCTKCSETGKEQCRKCNGDGTILEK